MKGWIAGAADLYYERLGAAMAATELYAIAHCAAPTSGRWHWTQLVQAQLRTGASVYTLAAPFDRIGEIISLLRCNDVVSGRQLVPVPIASQKRRRTLMVSQPGAGAIVVPMTTVSQFEPPRFVAHEERLVWPVAFTGDSYLVCNSQGVSRFDQHHEEATR